MCRSPSRIWRHKADGKGMADHQDNPDKYDAPVPYRRLKRYLCVSDIVCLQHKFTFQNTNTSFKTQIPFSKSKSLFHNTNLSFKTRIRTLSAPISKTQIRFCKRKSFFQNANPNSGRSNPKHKSKNTNKV